MSWITPKTRGTKSRVIGFRTDGKVENVSIGKCSLPQANQFKAVVDRLEQCRRMDLEPDPMDVFKIESMGSRILKRFHNAGLIGKSKSMMTVSELCDLWMDKIREETDKKGTHNNHGQECKRLKKWFGDRLVSDLSVKDVATWKKNRWEQINSRYVFGRSYQNCRTILGYAVQLKEISENPFAKGLVKRPTKGDVRQYVYVDLESVKSVLRAAPNNATRLMFCLGRFAGLRNDSEFKGLLWEHVDFKEGLIDVYSPKKGENRQVPIFPELRPFLLAEHREHSGKSEYILGSLSKANKTPVKHRMDKLLRGVIDDAGIERWPCLWQSLRASAINDRIRKGDKLPMLDRVFGNSDQVRKVFYEMQLEDDLKAATKGDALKWK